MCKIKATYLLTQVPSVRHLVTPVTRYTAQRQRTMHELLPFNEVRGAQACDAACKHSTQCSPISK